MFSSFKANLLKLAVLSGLHHQARNQTNHHQETVTLAEHWTSPLSSLSRSLCLAPPCHILTNSLAYTIPRKMTWMSDGIKSRIQIENIGLLWCSWHVCGSVYFFIWLIHQNNHLPSEHSHKSCSRSSRNSIFQLTAHLFRKICTVHIHARWLIQWLILYLYYYSVSNSCIQIYI